MLKKRKKSLFITSWRRVIQKLFKWPKFVHNILFIVVTISLSIRVDKTALNHWRFVNLSWCQVFFNNCNKNAIVILLGVIDDVSSPGHMINRKWYFFFFLLLFFLVFFFLFQSNNFSKKAPKRPSLHDHDKFVTSSHKEKPTFEGMGSYYCRYQLPSRFYELSNEMQTS